MAFIPEVHRRSIMRKYRSRLIMSTLLLIATTAKADGNAAIGAVLGAAVGGYAGNQATDNGKPVKHGAAYGAAAGAVLGALLAPSDSAPATGKTEDAQQPVVQQAITQPSIVYVINGPQAYTNARVITQEQAYWQGYRDAQRYRAPFPRYGCEYGGFRYRDDYCRY
jgi:hypothetical protein